MRFAVQPWSEIVARMEVVVGGVGIAGLNPLVAIQRVSDAQYLANGGGSWAAGYATNPLVAVDAVNQPGLYAYTVPLARLDFGEAVRGYRLRYTEAATPITEHEYITARQEFNGPVSWGFATAGAAGTVTFNVWAPATAGYWNDHFVTIVKGTGAGQTRLITAYSGGRVADVRPNWVTNPDATSQCVVHAGARSDVGAWVGANPNALVGGRVDADVGAMQPSVRTAIAADVWATDVEAALGSSLGLMLIGTTSAVQRSAVGLLASVNEALVQGHRNATATEWNNIFVSSGLGTVSKFYYAAVKGPIVAQSADWAGKAAVLVVAATGARRLVRIVQVTTDGAVHFQLTLANGSALPSAVAASDRLIVLNNSALTVADIFTATMSGYETAGTFGNHVNRMLRLRQENMRVVYTAWSTHGQPTAGYVLLYSSSADLGTDTGPGWALAKGRYDFAATYDGNLQLTGYESVRTS